MNRKKMRKALCVLMVLLLMAGASPLSAAIRYRTMRMSVATSTALVLPAGTWVCGIGMHATSASAQMGIYNSATLAGATTPIDEVGEATQYNTIDRPWVDPIYFNNGVTIIVENGVGFVDYAVRQ